MYPAFLREPGWHEMKVRIEAGPAIAGPASFLQFRRHSIGQEAYTPNLNVRLQSLPVFPFLAS